MELVTLQRNQSVKSSTEEKKLLNLNLNLAPGTTVKAAVTENESTTSDQSEASIQ